MTLICMGREKIQMADYHHAKRIVLLLLALAMTGIANSAFAQGTAFTYQGRLQDGSTSANGNYDFQFTLWDALSGGTQQPQAAPVTVTKSNVVVTNGVFTTQLDFGAAAFSGGDRFLETSVRLSGAASFTLLSPRQPITSTPYAVRSASAASADVATSATNANQLGGVAADQYVVTSDSRLSDSRAPTAGSSNYIQNNISPQPGSNFNISGDGRVGGTLSSNIVSATTQFNLGSNRVLATGNNSIFAGFGTGQSTTSGARNSFFGVNAGFNNTSGSDNVFLGLVAGFANTSGNANTFVGAGAGNQNSTGNGNAFFGWDSGQNNTGSGNSFAGAGAGLNNSTGSSNSFLGNSAGNVNTTGNNNTAVGVFSNFAANNLVNATAIGANAFVGQNNSLVLGSISGTNGASANTNVGIGTTAPTQRLHVVGNGLFTGNLTVNGSFSSPILNADTQFNIAGNRVLTIDTAYNTYAGFWAGINNTTGAQNSFFGNVAGSGNTTGSLNSFFGALSGISSNGSQNAFFGSSSGYGNSTGNDNSYFGYWTGHNTNGTGNSFMGSLAGGSTTSGNYNSFFGFSAGGSNLTGTSNTLVGDNANVGAGNLSNATAIGSHAFVSANNSLVLGSVNGVNGATASTNVAIGTTSPIGRLNVVGSAGPTQGIQFDNREIKFRGDGFAHFSIFANRVPGTLTIEDTSSSFAMNTAGTLGLSIASGSGNVGIGTNGPAAALEVHRNGTISSDWQTGQLRISGASDPNMQLSLGYDTSSNVGAIQAGQAFTGFKPLRLNPFGGEVAIGSVVPTTSENLIVGSARVVTGLFLGVVSGGGTSQLCLDGSGKVTLCSSSVRYKTNIRDFSPGLGLIQQLKPIRFEWKGSGDSDFGLVAEDVEKINPLLVTYNKNRQIEGVKYDRIGVVLINAVKEQQAQIESQQAIIQQQEQRARNQQTMLATQQRQIDALKKLVCQTHRRAAVCR